MNDMTVESCCRSLTKRFQIFVRKEIDYRRMSEKEKKQLVAEVNILRELNHPHIVRYIDRVLDRDNCMIYLVMEYCENGDLAAVIRRCKREKYLFCHSLVIHSVEVIHHLLCGIANGYQRPKYGPF